MKALHAIFLSLIAIPPLSAQEVIDAPPEGLTEEEKFYEGNQVNLENLGTRGPREEEEEVRYPYEDLYPYEDFEDTGEEGD